MKERSAASARNGQGVREAPFQTGARGGVEPIGGRKVRRHAPDEQLLR